MAWILGMALGGLIGGYMFFTLFRWLFAKLSPSNDMEPAPRAMRHGIAGLIIFYTVFALISWDSPNFFLSCLLYVPGIALGWWDMHRRYVKGWSKSELGDTFQ